MSVLVANYSLAATGVLYSANVNNMSSLTFIVDDNGGGSTITFEYSTDNSTWNAMATGVFSLGTGVLVAAGSTTTAKGRFVVDLTGIVYWRARVSTYVNC